MNIYVFGVCTFLTCILVCFAISLFTRKPEAAQIQGLCFGTATKEQKAETRASWNKWDIIHTVIILSVIIAFYVYFW